MVLIEFLRVDVPSLDWIMDWRNMEIVQLGQQFIALDEVAVKPIILFPRGIWIRKRDWLDMRMRERMFS